MQVGTTAFLGGLFGASDSNELQLGVLDDFAVAHEGDNVEIDPEVIDFVGSLINVTETSDGVEISVTEPEPNVIGGSQIHIQKDEPADPDSKDVWIKLPGE